MSKRHRVWIEETGKLLRKFRSCLCVLLTIIASIPTYAGTIDSASTYRGTINGVAVNYWSGVGVGLTDGATCNGQSTVILLYTDPHYKDTLSVLMTAETTGKNVRMYRLLDQIQTYYTNYAYCVTAVSLGDFPVW